MQRWLVLAALAAVCLAEAEKPIAEKPVVEVSEPVADESRRRDYENELPGPEVIRELDHNKLHHLSRERIEEQNRIIRHVYSPDYAQPTWVLDYRYLKTGGRDYTRSDGGQILILPRGVRSPDKHKQFGNFDELLEFLRLQNLAETERHRLHPSRSHGMEYERERELDSWNRY